MDQLTPSPVLESARRAREAAAVEAGMASIAAGRTISLAAVVTWLDKLDIDPDAPIPQPD